MYVSQVVVALVSLLLLDGERTRLEKTPCDGEPLVGLMLGGLRV